MSTIQRQFSDATCQISLAITSSDTHNLILGFESHNIVTTEKVVKFEAKFKFPTNHTFTQENLYLAVVNYLLHSFYDEMVMSGEEESVFCEINNCLEDNLTAWEQGEIYLSNIEKLFDRAPTGYSATDIIRVNEEKMRNIIKLIFSEMA